MVPEQSGTNLKSAAPVILVADIASTLQWYEAHLGFSGRAVPEDPPHTFGILVRDEVEIMLQQFDGYRMPSLYGQREGGVWNVYLRVEGVHDLFRRVRNDTGVTILEPLCRQEYGESEFVIKDPNGYVLVFAERES